jgi:hypothetical protein
MSDEDPIIRLQREWSLLASSLPRDGEALGRFIAEQPPERRVELEGMAAEILKSRDLIERRIAALEASRPTPPVPSQDPSTAAWQNQLARMVMIGWAEGEDFLRLEGMMPDTWPGTLPHPVTSDWLPFSRWILDHWASGQRVGSILILDPRPEFASELSSGLSVTAVTTSQHDLVLMTFLARMRPATPTTTHFAAVQGDTGHEEALRIRQGEFQAFMLGASAWNKWRKAPRVMLEWMLTEMSERVFHLAIDSVKPPDEDLFLSSGWIRDPEAPKSSSWSVWKVVNHGKGPASRPFAKCRVARVPVHALGDIERVAVLSGGALTVSHFAREAKTTLFHSHGRLTADPGPPAFPSLESERLSWASVSGVHPMIPNLVSEPSPHSLLLELEGADVRWMPQIRAETTPETARSIADLIDLLARRGILPRGLNVTDFARTSRGIFLTRIGFSGSVEEGDPLSVYLRILAGWNLQKPPSAQILDDPLLPDRRIFPEGFREAVDLALSSYSWADFRRE